MLSSSSPGTVNEILRREEESSWKLLNLSSVVKPLGLDASVSRCLSTSGLRGPTFGCFWIVIVVIVVSVGL